MHILYSTSTGISWRRVAHDHLPQLRNRWKQLQLPESHDLLGHQSPTNLTPFIDEEKEWLFAETGRLHLSLTKANKEIERLKSLMPPDERGPGFVSQGSWSVFAEKVLAERDAALERVTELTECLRWYVQNDETQEGGTWEESNGFWLRGKRRAMRALGMED